jgi:tetratricopeptide (TPR) repeat protein
MFVKRRKVKIELAIKRGNSDLDKSFKVLQNKAESLRLLAQAESEYQRAARLNPKDWRAAVGLANVCSEEGRKNDEVYFRQRAIALRPGDAYLYWQLGLMFAADPSKQTEAGQAYRRSMKSDYAEKLLSEINSR